jgi:hypothetical protein
VKAVFLPQSHGDTEKSKDLNYYKIFFTRAGFFKTGEREHFCLGGRNISLETGNI